MKLSKVQEKVLGKMEIGVDYSACDLKCSLVTLNALRKKRMITITYNGAGSYPFPRLGIKWQILDGAE